MKVVAYLTEVDTRTIDVQDVEKVELRPRIAILTMKSGESLSVIGIDPKRDFDNFDKPVSGLRYLLQNVGCDRVTGGEPR
jgi:hypothetical protein